jgi:hypothetical protein
MKYNICTFRLSTVPVTKVTWFVNCELSIMVTNNSVLYVLTGLFIIACIMKEEVLMSLTLLMSFHDCAFGRRCVTGYSYSYIRTGRKVKGFDTPPPPVPVHRQQNERRWWCGRHTDMLSVEWLGGNCCWYRCSCLVHC